MMIAQKEILIVEDEPGFRTLLHKKLKSAGYRTVLAQNGEEALVALWENEDIALVLLDVRLPYINGLNIFEIIRKDFPGKKIIISSAFHKDEQQFLIKDADDYYCKGDDLGDLIEKIGLTISHKSISGIIMENEKRSFKRIPTNILASCESSSRHTAFSPLHFYTYTKDLSMQGGKFVIAQDVKIGQHFSAALELPANFLPILVDCEVVWVKKMEESDPNARGNAEVGVKFVKLGLPQDEERLKKYFNFG